MAGIEMTLWRVASGTVVVAALFAADADLRALHAVAPNALDRPPGTAALTGPEIDVNDTRRAVPKEPELTGNPLWAVPLSTLSATPERPILSPSRRPPPRAIVGPPPPPPVRVVAPKPQEPERPQLALVGTVAGETGGIGVFMDETTRNVVRLKVGEGHDGWILTSVRGREATLQKNRETAVILALPAPGAETAAPAAAPSFPLPPASTMQAPPAARGVPTPQPRTGGDTLRPPSLPILPSQPAGGRTAVPRTGAIYQPPGPSKPITDGDL
jgi:general secretion pathway protein N